MKSKSYGTHLQMGQLSVRSRAFPAPLPHIYRVLQIAGERRETGLPVSPPTATEHWRAWREREV
jgi:hypothetical protein